MAVNIDIPGQGKVLAHYGEEAQAMIHMEECAELIQAISKMRRVRHAVAEGRCLDDTDAYYNLVEEMADVLICMEQMQEMYCISDRELRDMVIRKCSRQEDRMYELDRKLFEG